MNEEKLTNSVKPQEEEITSTTSVQQMTLAGAATSGNDERPKIGSGV